MLRIFSLPRFKAAFLCIAALGLLAVLVGYPLAGYSENMNTGLSDRLVRLHVIANSDSEDDQKLKRDVRDAVISYMKPEFSGIKDVEQSKTIIRQKLDEINKVAEGVIKSSGKSYGVVSELGVSAFPTKTYGDIALPAGNYEALRIKIGEAKGANWWCVLFPPLCFVDATHGTVPDSVKQNLKETLTDEEYNIITSSSGDDDIPVKLKFKVVEFFQDSRIKFTGVISKIFK